MTTFARKRTIGGMTRTLYRIYTAIAVTAVALSAFALTVVPAVCHDI